MKTTLNKRIFVAIFMGILPLTLLAAEKSTEAGKGGPAARDGMRDIDEAQKHPVRKSKEKELKSRHNPAPMKPMATSPAPSKVDRPLPTTGSAQGSTHSPEPLPSDAVH